jgi:hypothetical protein
MTPLFGFKRKFKTAEYPSTFVQQEEKTGGRFDVNLALMVRDHGPIRLDTIDREIHTLTEQITKLQKEREVIIKLVEVVNV